MPILVRSKRRAEAVPAVAASSDGTKKGALPFNLPMPKLGRPQLPPGISLCMIVKNEERFLAQCLRSAQDVVDEIIVVDTGSTDRTVEIAQSFGAKVFHREWRNDFAWARNQALEQATKRWIFILDADEELTPASKAELRKIKDAPAEHTALWTRLYNKSDDYQGTGDMSHALIRVFPNDPAIRYRGLIHEFATLDGDPNGLKGVTTPIAIVHHGYVKEVVMSRDKGARNLAIVRAAAEAEPDDAYHWFNLGATAFLVDDYETARDALEHMRSILGTHTRGFVPNALAVLAETYCDKLGQPEKGEEVARACLKVSPHYANAHFQLGKCLIAQGRFDEAREAYEAAIDDGKYAALQFVIDDQVYIWKAHSELGSSYVLQKNDEKALEWFEKGIKNAPKAEPLLINRARCLERLGRLDAARDAYRGVYEMHGGEQSTTEYINFLLRQKKEREAADIIEQAYPGLPPEHAVTLLLAAAAIAQRAGSLDDERYLRAAAELAPGRADVLNPLEALLRQRGKTHEIPGLIAREESVPPQSAADYNRRARRAIERGDFQLARTIAGEGLERTPGDPTLGYALGVSQASLGDEAAAIETLAGITDGPRDIMLLILTMHATLLQRNGRAPEALERVRAALRIDPQNVEALLAAANLYAEAGDLQAQEEALKTAFDADPGERVAVELSTFYLRAGRFPEAAAIAGRALEA